MSKSFGVRLLCVAEAILRDCQAIFPNDLKELKRDKVRLSVLVETRGLGVFTLDFPALLKHFDRCLNEGAYTKPNLPLSRTVNASTPIPRLFKGLVLRVFDESGMLRNNPDINAVAALRQLYAVGKKLRIECKENRVHEMVHDFLRIEEQLPSNFSRLGWSCQVAFADVRGRSSFCDPLLRQVAGHQDYDEGGEETLIPVRARCPASLQRLEILQRVADRITSHIGQFDPYEWRPKHGPGAVSDLKRGDNKYAFPSWSEKLETVFPYADFAFANIGVWADRVSEDCDGHEDEPSSKLIAVPKTQKGPRLIAAEPTAHQWCQQIIWDFLETRVRSIFLSSVVHFRDQRKNQELARLASETGSHWTVDLSSASDYLSLWSVERFFRRNPSFLDALAASRTMFLTQTLDKKQPHRIELKKFSTMGSACTFPVQSIFFAGMAITSILASRGWKVSTHSIKMACRETLVFGDDIIIPEDAGETLLALMGDLGFKVNTDKTCRSGSFRESCGVDAFRGYDVTPAYITQFSRARKPESVHAGVQIANNFWLKGWWSASAYLQSTVAIGKLPIVSADSGVLGWKSFCGPKIVTKLRYNKDLQREEFRTEIVTTSVRKRPHEDEAGLLQFFTEEPDPWFPWSSGIAQRPRIAMRRGWEDVRVLASDS